MMSLHLLLAVAFSFLFSAHAGDPSDVCVYSLYVQTGAFINSGTDSKISVALSDETGKTVSVPELRSVGLMAADHDYFEMGSLDIFSVRGECLRPPICRLNVTSDGSGHRPGWFCQFVEMTVTGPHKGCSRSVFLVGRWLVSGELTPVLDACDWGATSGTLVVSDPIGLHATDDAYVKDLSDR